MTFPGVLNAANFSNDELLSPELTLQILLPQSINLGILNVYLSVNRFSSGVTCTFNATFRWKGISNWWVHLMSNLTHPVYSPSEMFHSANKRPYLVGGHS